MSQPLEDVIWRSGQAAMSAFEEETVLSVHHWTDRLFSFRSEEHTSELQSH